MDFTRGADFKDALVQHFHDRTLPAESGPQVELFRDGVGRRFHHTPGMVMVQGARERHIEYADDGSMMYTTPSGTTAENVILEGSDVVSASPAMTQDQTTGEYQYVVNLQLSE